MAPSLPPGPVYLARVAAQLSALIVLVHAAKHYVPDVLPKNAWPWAYILALPVGRLVKDIFKSISENLEMRQLNARKLPILSSWVPLQLDILFYGARTFLNGYITESMQNWIDSTGNTFSLRAMGRETIITVEPEHVKAILATDFDNFEKGDHFQSYMRSVLGTGVFNADGTMWKFHRGITRPFFSRDRISDFEIFDKHAEILITKMKERLAEGEAVDFQDLVGRFTLDSATEFLFGTCVHSLSATLPYAWNSPCRLIPATSHSSDKFVKAFGLAQETIALRARVADVYPLIEFWKDKTEDPMKEINAFMDPILESVLKRKKSMEASHDEEKDAASHFTLLDDLVTKTDNIKILKDETLNIMIAGRDTTMCLLTFTIYCLSQHSNALMTLREEILTKVGPTRRPTLDDIKNLKYLRAVLNESLRLYGPVPFNVRRSKHATTLSSHDGGKPYYVPANTDVAYSTFIIHRRKDLWGPDAWEFDPNRFLDERVHKYLTPNPFIFIPFNAGPRICLGQQFAYNEASLMLIRLLQNFDSIVLDHDAQPPKSRPPDSWKLGKGTQPKEKIWPKCHLTLYSYKGLWVRMGEAKHTDTV